MFILVKIFMSAIALVGIISPRFLWKISEGWKFKNAEPSTAYLTISRIIFAIMLILIWFVIPN